MDTYRGLPASNIWRHLQLIRPPRTSITANTQHASSWIQHTKALPQRAPENRMAFLAHPNMGGMACKFFKDHGLTQIPPPAGSIQKRIPTVTESGIQSKLYREPLPQQGHEAKKMMRIPCPKDRPHTLPLNPLEYAKRLHWKCGSQKRCLANSPAFNVTSSKKRRFGKDE